ncbi:MAG: hypothetical protein IPM42_15935 [Saprospiraceae bacterium]|nr:hypothetical protein [Saprospiraceae bacterium]
MKRNKMRLKRKSVSNNGHIKGTDNMFIQPFREMPSVVKTGEGSVDRISAHDLFSFYTADIIKEDTIFAR